ncbi:MAG: hypothetical protein KDA75_06570 [Planctomycetaceae bacterium]|nr:hypothetical protein [Planctomycetaceae bacterium]
MAKLNGEGIKQFFINHGEKVGLGVVGLVVVYALATATWVPYDGDPEEIKTKAEEAKKQYLAQEIKPEDEQQLELVVAPEDRPAALVNREMLDDLSAGNWNLAVLMSSSPNDGKVPLKEAQDLFERHPIRNLSAAGSYVLLNLGPEVPEAEEIPDATDTSPVPPALADSGAFPNSSILDDRFERRANTGSGGAGGEGGPGSMDYMSSYYSPEIDYYDEYGGEGGEMSYAGTTLKGRGQPFIAVRGIVPLHELIRDVSEARNCSFAEAAQFFQLIDYQLERQEANADGTWPADDAATWTPVDRATAEAILGEVDGFDLDPVPPQLTDVAVTMPLPARITGVWKTLATHKDLESYSLSSADMENELKYQRALIKKAQEDLAQQQGAQVEQTGPKVKGWAPVAYDSRKIASDLMGSSSAYGDSYEDYYAGQNSASLYGTMSTGQNDTKFNELVKDLSDMVDKEQDKALRDYIKNRVTAVGNLLLFRYIDFAVEPGKTYRYRARLEIENPSFGESVVDASVPSVVEGETRFNSWSNITEPVTVDRDTYYFVHNVDRRKNFVAMDFYHFDPGLGTIVSNTEPDPPEEENLNSVPRLEIGYGEPIGGNLPVWELSPAAYTFAKDEEGPDDDGDPKGYAFQSGDVLVAALDDYAVNRNEHPDLKIPKAANYSLQLVEAVLVQKKDGSLMQLDTASQTYAEQLQKLLITRQNEPFRDLKGGGALDGDTCPCLANLYMGYMEGDAGMEGGSRRSNTRTRSPLRKSGSRADAGVRSAGSAARSSGKGRGGPPAP